MFIKEKKCSKSPFARFSQKTRKALAIMPSKIFCSPTIKRKRDVFPRVIIDDPLYHECIAVIMQAATWASRCIVEIIKRCSDIVRTLHARYHFSRIEYDDGSIFDNHQSCPHKGKSWESNTLPVLFSAFPNFLCKIKSVTGVFSGYSWQYSV